MHKKHFSYKPNTRDSMSKDHNKIMIKIDWWQIYSWRPCCEVKIIPLLTQTSCITHFPKLCPKFCKLSDSDSTVVSQVATKEKSYDALPKLVKNDASEFNK